MGAMTDPLLLARAVAAGDRRALSRAITLVESTRSDHRAAAEAMLAALPRRDPAIRLGLTGTPGAGKSTLIEALGTRLTAQGRRVAVLAVDPSSARSGGSILGDRTRMDRLARDPRAYVRPSPAGAELGGVARRTREAILLCEGAGFDVVIVETVGVGQSETLAAGMTDLFALVLAPHGGDDLQGIKRGIVEVADLILVNKADRDPQAARQAVGDYAAALRLLRARTGDPEGWPRAMAVSAMTGEGLDEAWQALADLWLWRCERGLLERQRAAQRRAWFEEELHAQALEKALADPALAAAIPRLADEAAAGRLLPGEAARRALGG
ncbi:LAO/AO transport system ATPase [Rubellimicrobium thermophilum DSM 16684]|uniref:LAO/AO transport system ATPase n=1 Tax=Rubellimicrobium thermophilum DSM 16684 TaxID=1123069 RepID=S9R5Z9_9RHOB|nr:methylmalonyl Co-A mutase-associated GTPase MeaB [Rubellimicrobium thermophilum]EPX87423.1 LAO/AO transport system ATPase [Rubellimicrobium thermophilum DSM 16684]